MTDRKQPAGDCAQARGWIHAVLDGDLMDAEALQALDRHLANCAGCREVRTELEQIQSTLRAMPDLPLPDAAFEEVLASTSRATVASRVRRWGLDWRAAAAAVVLAAALLSTWSIWPTGPDQAQVDQAAAEAKMVLMLTAQALSRSQRVAIREGITGGVSPALSRVPMKMPKAPDAPRELLEKDL